MTLLSFRALADTLTVDRARINKTRVAEIVQVTALASKERIAPFRKELRKRKKEEVTLLRFVIQLDTRAETLLLVFFN
jgi:hypothetical protein